MTEFLTAAQMRAAERAAIDSGAVSGLELMERAGRGVVEAMLEQWPDLAQGPQRAIVLCGPGNNGGDGFVVARMLKARGWQVTVVFFGEAGKLPPDARVNYDRWADMGVVAPLTLAAVKAAEAPDIWVDALFGLGLTRRAEGELAAVLRHFAGDGVDGAGVAPKMVAVDVPSGLDADSGEILGKRPEERVPPCPVCALTVTFHRPKPGHVSRDGPAHCGRLVVKPIGL